MLKNFLCSSLKFETEFSSNRDSIYVFLSLQKEFCFRIKYNLGIENDAFRHSE